MAKDKTAAENWTQEYCTPHIGFCFPVHRNWWFKSFGTTTSSLWYVEVSSEEVQNLGEGPIVVKLVAGTVESAGGSERSVQEKDGFVVGLRSWSENRHFEITGPQSLAAHIKYITEKLKPLEE